MSGGTERLAAREALVGEVPEAVALTVGGRGGELRRLWVRNFWAAFFPLLVLKYALVLNNLFGTEGYESVPLFLAKSLLFLGSDVLGAALLATLAGLTAAPFLAVRLPGAALGVSIAWQIAHALVAALSFLAVVFQGGPINKQALDMAFLPQPGSEQGLDPALLQSTLEYVTPANIALLAGTLAVALAALLFVPRLFGRIRRRWVRLLVAILAVEALLTVGLVPRLMSGELGGIRIFTHGLEKSPLVELGWSYVKPALADLRAPADERGDPFRFDRSSVVTPDAAPMETLLAKAHPARTNVVVVLLESIGAPYLDTPEAPMPFLSSFRDRPGAVWLAQHYSTWSLTTKALFSIVCSELPYPTFLPITYVNPSIPCRSLTEVLHDAGYYTMFVTGQDLAYDRQMRFFRHRKLDFVEDMRSIPEVTEEDTLAWGLDDRVTVREVLARVREDRNRPFFLLFGTVAGHHPFIACKEHERAPLEDRMQAYNRALRFADDRLRELFDGLAATGHLEDTLVVVLSDHGEGHGAKAGRNVYEGVVKVPVALAGPQLAGLHGEVDLVTSHLDLAPTILALLGLPVPCTMKGRDLTRPVRPELVLFGGRPPKFQLGLVDGPYKYINEDAASVEMLYDLRVDPTERDNVVEAHPELVASFRARIEAYERHAERLIEDYATILSESDCRP